MMFALPFTEYLFIFSMVVLIISVIYRAVSNYMNAQELAEPEKWIDKAELDETVAVYKGLIDDLRYELKILQHQGRRDRDRVRELETDMEEHWDCFHKNREYALKHDVGELPCVPKKRGKTTEQPDSYTNYKAYKDSQIIHLSNVMQGMFSMDDYSEIAFRMREYGWRDGMFGEKPNLIANNMAERAYNQGVLKELLHVLLEKRPFLKHKYNPFLADVELMREQEDRDDKR